MIVKCGINGELRHVSQIFLCHHCGMPVCEEHGWVVVADEAFADTAMASSTLPASGIPSAPGNPGAPVPQQIGAAVAARRAAIGSAPQPAMHCRECVDRFHKGALKRHGWADPRPSLNPVGR